MLKTGGSAHPRREGRYSYCCTAAAPLNWLGGSGGLPAKPAMAAAPDVCGKGAGGCGPQGGGSRVAWLMVMARKVFLPAAV